MAGCRVHLLDVGQQQYGDCALLELGDATILIDGAHPKDADGAGDHASIPSQLRKLLKLGKNDPINLSLIVITHAHNDHVGCIPTLVARGELTAGWALVADPDLAWGYEVGEQDHPADLASDAVLLGAALREEPYSAFQSDAEFREFAADAANLRTRYLQMIETLEEKGTLVVRFRGHDADNKHYLDELENAFSEIGFRVLGPSAKQVELSAQELIKRKDNLVPQIGAALDTVSGTSLLNRYYGLLSPNDDSSDAMSQGVAVNMMSVVFTVDCEGNKMLFTGDNELEDPPLSDEEVRTEIDALMESIRQAGPYHFAKMGHHGSYNAFGEKIMEAMGDPKVLGLSTGENSQKHPAQQTLDYLSERKKELTWVRTDVNRRTSLEFGADDVGIGVERGGLNDASPPKRADAPRSVGSAAGLIPSRAAPTSPAPAALISGPIPAADPIEIQIEKLVLKVPPNATLRIEISSMSGIAPAAALIEHQPAAIRSAPDPALVIAGGRALPPLLILTDRTRLSSQIGAAEAEAILASVEAHRSLHLVDVKSDSRSSIELAREAWQGAPAQLEGIVILGGYDVIPATSVDCLPGEMRAQLGARVNNDDDRFVVWSDGIYGDRSGDGIADVPVSRIPDGASATLVRNALGSGAPSMQAAAGLRNYQRPFADQVYSDAMGVNRGMDRSKDLTCSQSQAQLSGDAIYLMLHGSYLDTSKFWGEDTPDDEEALNIGNIVNVRGATILAGCCWGALIVSTPAALSSPHAPAATLTPAGSLALAFLEGGARAFVGCTGTHYSPLRKPFNYFGAPIHNTFWRAYRAGKPPAVALHQAKLAYVADFPHGRSDLLEQAIEYKILAQFTCLGLGW